MIDEIRIESDDDGWHLVLLGDFEIIAPRFDGGCLNLRLPQDVAEQLLEQVRPIAEHVAEREQHRREYLAASPEERARVLGSVHLDCGVDPDRIEDMRQRADEQRKREREDGRS